MNTPQFEDAVNYVMKQLTNGVSEEVIDQSLADAGYSDELIDTIFDEVDARISESVERPSTFKQAIQAHDEKHADLFDSVWYILKNLGLFRGRLSRLQYLVASVFYVLTLVAITFVYLSYILEPGGGLATSSARAGSFFGSGLTIIFVVFAFVQYFSILSRRFHDFNISGWAGVTIFIPVVGTLVPFYLLFKKGSATENTYGHRRAGFNYFDLFGWRLYEKPTKTVTPEVQNSL